MAHKWKAQRQRAIPGRQRVAMSTYAEKEVEKAIQREAAHFRVSRSFVIKVACAVALGVELDVKDTYRPTAPRLQLVAGHRRRA